MNDEKVVSLNVAHIGPREDALTLVDHGRPCPHLHLEIDEAREVLTCLDCRAPVNPMWALGRMAREESLWNWKRKRLIEAREKLEARSRTTCEHCKRMTRINRS